VFSYGLLRRFARTRNRFALAAGTDSEGTAQRIEDGIDLRGERAWLLICSCLLASIGLDTGSVAVIIGAMLISPLMSPILGVGLGTAVADRPMLQHAARELALATGITLGVSTLYFTLTPLGEPTSELISRTQPTLLDVGVALFGGIAGIVAGSRREQSLALPGVAIATALMPPLCTAGFGLATGRPAFFFGALYLYVINAIFISLATFGIARFLQFPLRSFSDAKKRKREIRLVSSIATIAILPSLWFLYFTVQEARETRRIGQFLTSEVEKRGGEVMRWTRVTTEDSTRIKLFLAGAAFEPETIDSLTQSLDVYGLDDYGLDLVQSGISSRELRRMETDVQRGILQAIEIAQQSRDSAAAALSARNAAARRGSVDTAQIRLVARELAQVFPELVTVSYVSQDPLLAADSLSSTRTLLVEFGAGVAAAKQREILDRGRSLLQARLGNDSVQLVARQAAGPVSQRR
jgi:uncharacterized hydrophobic protein (TIGR00271 family)